MPAELMNSGNSKLKYILGGILIGAAAGSALALLYAPKTGKGTRQYLKFKAFEAKETAVEKANQAKNKVNKWVKEARESECAEQQDPSKFADCVKEQKG